MNKKFWKLLFVVCFTIINSVFAGSYQLQSPDKKIEVVITLDKDITFSVNLDKKPVILPSKIAIILEGGKVLGEKPVMIEKKTRSISREIVPEIKEKCAVIKENFNELSLSFKKRFALVFRAYDNGIAYRFETNFPGRIIVENEIGDFHFAGDYTVYWPREKSFESNNQVYYDYKSLSELSSKDLGSLPVLINTTSGAKLLISEADLEDYPGMWFRGAEGNKLSAAFARCRKEVEQKSDRDVLITKRENYIAKTSGIRTFPWRFVAIAENDGDLITNQLSWLLAKPCVLQDVSWIKPGKVAWDWWNANNVYHVDFRAGINTETYKYYIDFASKYGIEYVIFDEGWYKLGDLLAVVPEMDMEELLQYAKKKNVGIILWVVWKTLDDQLEQALDQFERWGVAGLKVDFMDSDDQWMVNFYHKIARLTAERKFLIDFHGAYKPTGLRRTYPHVLTREGVNGGEQYKWSLKQTPEHNLITPFSRMVAGPMDYTPGAMNNAHEKNFRPIFNRPMSMGTRCHQLAMYVIYESPLQMLCDSPTNYLREPEIMEFLSPVPVVWDETVVLKAKVADYLILARRHGDEWYLGAMADWQPREFDIGFSFLKDGKYQMTIFKDGINADRCAIDYKKEVLNVTPDSKLHIKMAPGGGFAARIIVE